MRRACFAYWICVLAACAGSAASARDAGDFLRGTWSGSALFEESRLEFSVRFYRQGTALRGTMSSADLLLLDQPLAGVQSHGRHVRFSTAGEPALRFDGVVVGDSIHGAAAVPAVPGVVSTGQIAQPLRFSLGRAAAPAATPYATREIHFASGAARLAATAFLPSRQGGDLAGLVVLQGSSSNLRQEYLYYADHFARAGLAVLTFDKRGSGESTGDYGAATYDDLAGDAAAAVECLRHLPGVDPRRVGVWGLSQGAFIAPLVAARVPSLRFVVAVSAPGMPIGESATYQDSIRLTSAGFDVADVRRAVSLDRRLLEWLRSGEDQTKLAAMVANAANAPWRRASSLPARLPSGAALDGWYWRGRTLDPGRSWRELKVPVFAVYGAADELIPASRSARLIEQALHDGGNRDATVRVFPAANHVLHTLPLVAGGKWDWPRVAPGYMELTTDWILDHSRNRPRAPVTPDQR